MEKNSIRWEILLKGARGTLSPEEEIIFQKWMARDIPVSYTPLTLPTTNEV